MMVIQSEIMDSRNTQPRTACHIRREFWAPESAASQFSETSETSTSQARAVKQDLHIQKSRGEAV